MPMSNNDSQRPTPPPPPVQHQYHPQHQQQPQIVYMQQAGPKFSPGIAAILSFLIPGLGQMYRGKVLIGFLWLIAVLCGYAALVLPGFILHVICVAMAASGDPYK